MQEQTIASDNLLLWILIASELVVFAILLLAFQTQSFLHPAEFAAAKLLLPTRLAGFNTVVLLMSSCVAVCILQVRSRLAARLLLGCTLLLGAVFVTLKMIEYRGHLLASDAGYGPFNELYYLITGFHLLHVVFVGLLLSVAMKRLDRAYLTPVILVWHMVDLVWLTIFPILYLS